ncbi:P-loop containing nucleoside triphosphate hydrolase protein [Cokeromyces recurvatus]|uniref:P-loop containing nucleoside triphosphate hydrolase protein n=1 Tax=Cokeromyces recurvatus TaxID=90255 RepID=UPI00221FC0F4|nr:P-loop containing nucleoside triphosphate hydrolase protein [Cokeromyces recurvatus]KAI7904592.1 P-loop containing nucleoside triphosphate hydrolase protein [Cokeromyces recurvatus]
MRIFTIYAPVLKSTLPPHYSVRPVILLASKRFYHSADYTGGGLMGRDNFINPISTPPFNNNEDHFGLSTPLTDPRTIVQHLNEYVIGQERAKKVLAVAIYNHYNRVRANLKRQQQRQQQQQHQQEQLHLSSHMEGLDDKFHTEHHHPTLPQEYYSSQQLPLQSQQHNDFSSAENISLGAQRRAWLNPPTEASNNHKTVSPINESNTTRSSFEQELGDNTTVHDKSNVLLIGPTGSGKTLLARTLAQILQVPFSMSDATPFTQAGYVGEDVELVIQRLLQACDYDVKKAETGIVFIDEIDKISRRSDSHSASRDVSGEGVQQSLLRMLEGTIVNITDKSGASNNHKRGVPNGVGGGVGGGGGGGAISSPNKGETYSVDTSNILFILSGAFIGLDKIISDRMSKGSIGFNARIISEIEAENERKESLQSVEPNDLVKFGLIPEFVGRIPVVASVNNLKVNDLVRVLKEPKNSLLKQYEELFKLNHVQLRFSQAALEAIASQALEKKTGARGLRRIMENLLLEPMYDAPGSCIKQVIIDSKVVNHKKPPVYITSEKSQLAEKILAEDDGIDLLQSTNEENTLHQQQMTQ